MLGLRRFFENKRLVEPLLQGFREGMREQLVAGLSQSARSLFISALFAKAERPILVVTHNLLQAQKFYDDLCEFLGDEHVLLYPVNDLLAAEMAAQSPELKAQRFEALQTLIIGNRKKVLIAPVAAVRRFLPPVQLWKQATFSLKEGDVVDIEVLLGRLEAAGYERSEMTAAPGEFSIRGGIIDIFPLTEEMPVRIELFDDEVDSIRTFHADSQRSEEKRSTVTIGPASEIILFKEQYARAAERLKERLEKTIQKVKDPAVQERLDENIREEIEQLHEQQTFVGMAKYMHLFYKKPATLYDYVGANAFVVYDEMTRVRETVDHLQKEEAEWLTDKVEKGEFVRGVELSGGIEKPSLSRQVLYLSLFLRHVPHTNPENILNLSCRAMQNFHGQMNLLKSELERWKKNKFTVVFTAVNEERANRLQSVLGDYGMDAAFGNDETVVEQGVQIAIADISGGFELPLEKLAVVTEKEIFTKKIKKARRRTKMSNAERIQSYSELNVGDFVVHTSHGIGKYLGIETIEAGGTHKDYLHLRYAGGDKLYVPVDQIDQVQKYVGSEEKEPKIYKLGGNEWKRVKKKVQTSVQDIADDLIELYAEREASKGFAFSKDGPQQREFEAKFPYKETEDQLKAIEEVKRDMESIRPMDRLLCGDVGYGKTEVAIRAAFKAVMDGKQVAFLVPTTILAQQHYETFRERFDDYPVNIGLLSRFRTPKQLKETIKGVKQGTVDIVIGTHRLLSRDVSFYDLGLLVVDEEQRFGVTHKEKIKKLKANVDVLTLTATPIPRTLHMSMLGVRDLSIIETPPENRFPVQTYVAEYSDTLVREAIERELAREGQVYFLFNRVNEIERKAEQIARLVPDARVTFAHGQMKESELEAVMLDFLDGQYDVLVSTTIIETGVDIPNVNTLIVYDADKMGLAQLYQLRGRVGRSNRVAYAYLTYQPNKILNEVSEKRLQAIKEFTELGSGFKIAMRDLAIRGTGNLLGAQQHGFIDSVGFDLYSQMLQEAIQKRKGEVPKSETRTATLDLHVDAYLPEAYIADPKQKIDMYKRLRAADSLHEVLEIEEELLDRFGDFPREVRDMLAVVRVRVLANHLGVDSVKQEGTRLILLFTEQASKSLNRMALVETQRDLGRNIILGTSGEKLKVVLHKQGATSGDLLQLLKSFLQKIIEYEKQPA